MQTTDAALRLDGFLPFRLSFTSNMVSEMVAGAYRTLFDLTIPEWRTIAVVAEHDGISQQGVGGVTRMDKVTVSRAAIALTARGLVARRPNREDRRSHLLSLTEAGRSLYAQVAPKALELEGRVFAAFTSEELAGFTAMLRRIDAVVLAVEAGEASPVRPRAIG